MKQPNLLILDFDGTLATIAATPQKAALPQKTKEILNTLACKQNLHLAILSGRKLNDLKEKIGIRNIIYGGSHGFEWEILGKKGRYHVEDKTKKALKITLNKLKEIESKFQGVIVEEKGPVLSFHYRLAGQKAKIKSLFKEFIKASGVEKDILILPGKMVFDVCPKSEWNKGSFVKFLIRELKKTSKKEIVPVYIGDDETDESVFETLKDGITIKVGIKGQSGAKNRLKDTKEVLKFLESLSQGMYNEIRL